MFDHLLEKDMRNSRRQFLAAAGAATVAAMDGRSLLAMAAPPTSAPLSTDSESSQPGKQVALVQIGILLGTFARSTLDARLDAVKACGLDCVQVSLDCAGVPAMPDKISSELATRIRAAAGVRGITIAAVQGTFNMSHPEAEHRRTGLRRLRVLAEACSQMGTFTIHLCTGTRDRTSMWRRHPDNDSPAAWRDMGACMREAAEIARETGVVLAFEPEVNNVVDSAHKARRLLDEMASAHVKVTIDPANIFHSGELPRMQDLLDEAFALLGKDIVLAHAKDLDHDGDAGHLAAGHGKLDYDRYLSLLVKYGFHGPLLLHGLSEAQVPGCVAFLRKKLARAVLAPSRPVP